jgi:hypothetical protein
MRRLVLALALAAGCGDGSGPAEPPSGHYALATMNGAALPVRIPSSTPGNSVTVTAGALDFDQPNLVRLTMTFVLSTAGTTEPPATVVQDLTYSVSGSRLVFPQPTLSGSFDRRSVTLRDEGQPRLTSRYVKQ